MPRGFVHLARPVVGVAGELDIVAGQHEARPHAGELRLACPQGPVKRLLEVTAVWLQLHTQNVFDAAVFYGEVLEWAEQDVSGCCEVSYEEDQVALRRGGSAWRV